jgi:hypothetical protein
MKEKDEATDYRDTERTPPLSQHPFLRRYQEVPYKCPACDGWGNREMRQEQPMRDNQGVYQRPCLACKGTGIVWRRSAS